MPNTPGGVDISNTHLDVSVGPAGQAVRFPNGCAVFRFGPSGDQPGQLRPRR